MQPCQPAAAKHEALRHRDQHLVPGVVAVVVVDLLEAVEVEQHDGHRLVAAPGARERVLEPVPEQRRFGNSVREVVEGLLRKLVDAARAGGPQGGVLDDERALQRQLLHELALVLGPVTWATGVAADHDAERPIRGQQWECDIRAQPQQRDQLGRYQLALRRVLDENRFTLARQAARSRNSCPDEPTRRSLAIAWKSVSGAWAATSAMR